MKSWDIVVVVPGSPPVIKGKSHQFKKPSFGWSKAKLTLQVASAAPRVDLIVGKKANVFPDGSAPFVGYITKATSTVSLRGIETLQLKFVAVTDGNPESPAILCATCGKPMERIEPGRVRTFFFCVPCQRKVG